MAKIVLIAGLALCLAGVVGIVVQFLRRPRRRRLAEARAFYRRAAELLDQGTVDDALAMGREAVTTWMEVGPTIASPRLVARLATLAGDFGTDLHEIGRDTDAVIHLTAAETALRERVDAAPSRYQPRLARILAVRAAVEGDLGNYREALRYDGQAVPLLRHLVERDDPDAYAHPLAHALALEARHFYEIGRLSEALGCAGQAIERLRALPDRDRDSAAADLAEAAADRAAMLLAAGRVDDALAAAQEASGLRRTGPALNTLGEALLYKGKAAEARVPLREAAELARSADPGTPTLAVCLSTLAAALAVEAQTSGDKDLATEALAVALEAEALGRTLAGADPERYESVLALTLCSLARAHESLGQTEEARPYADEAVQLYEQVSAGRGRRFDVESQRAQAIRDRLDIGRELAS